MILSMPVDVAGIVEKQDVVLGLDNRELKQTDAAAVNRQISIQIQSDGCQGPTEFTWPSVLVNGNLQVGRRRVSLLKLPNSVDFCCCSSPSS